MAEQIALNPYLNKSLRMLIAVSGLYGRQPYWVCAAF
jgi:hypothetical protein